MLECPASLIILNASLPASRNGSRSHRTASRSRICQVLQQVILDSLQGYVAAAVCVLVGPIFILWFIVTKMESSCISLAFTPSGIVRALTVLAGRGGVS
jgi:hypothetical protein